MQLAGRILEFDPDVRGGKGYYLARDLLDSGRALEKMKAIIAAQDANNKSYQPGKLRHEVYAKTSGVIKAINNLKIARIARLAGAPMDKQAGIYLNKKLGEDVQKGELLYTIYAEFSSDFMFAYLAYMHQDCAFSPGEVVSQKVLGQLWAKYFDQVVTVDSHLHRIHELSEAIPINRAINLSPTGPMSDYLHKTVDKPFLIGPDEESQQ